MKHEKKLHIKISGRNKKYVQCVEKPETVCEGFSFFKIGA
jgi:hypothetical protein